MQNCINHLDKCTGSRPDVLVDAVNDGEALRSIVASKPQLVDPLARHIHTAQMQSIEHMASKIVAVMEEHILVTQGRSKPFTAKHFTSKYKKKCSSVQVMICKSGSSTYA